MCINPKTNGYFFFKIWLYFLMWLPISRIFFIWNWSNASDIWSALWIMMTCCFSTRASVATVVSMHPCMSSCSWVNGCIMNIWYINWGCKGLYAPCHCIPSCYFMTTHWFYSEVLSRRTHRMTNFTIVIFIWWKLCFAFIQFVTSGCKKLLHMEQYQTCAKIIVNLIKKSLQ